MTLRNKFVRIDDAHESFFEHLHSSLTRPVPGDLVSVAHRSDGYTFFLVKRGAKDFVIYAGCRKAQTLSWYRAHVKRYSSVGKRNETLRILDLFAYQIKAKWSKVS